MLCRDQSNFRCYWHRSQRNHLKEKEILQNGSGNREKNLTETSITFDKVLGLHPRQYIFKEGLLLFGGARTSKLGNPDRIAREHLISVSEISCEIAPVLMGEIISRTQKIRSKPVLTVAVSYQCKAIASIWQPVQLPKNCWSHWTPPPLVTAGLTSLAFPWNGSMLAFHSAAAVVGSMLDWPALSGSLNLRSNCPSYQKKISKMNHSLNGLPKQVGRASCDCCSRSARPSVNIIRAPAGEWISISIIWNDHTSRQTFLQHWSKFYAMIQSSIGKVVPIICPL